VHIKHALGITMDGAPQPSPSAPILRNLEFIVDRASGRVFGDGAPGYDVWKYEVLDPGSKAQSYKSIYLSSGGPYRHIDYLQVEEFREGDVKPFLLHGARSCSQAPACIFVKDGSR
jgi:hypothetical protein